MGNACVKTLEGALTCFLRHFDIIFGVSSLQWEMHVSKLSKVRWRVFLRHFDIICGVSRLRWEMHASKLSKVR